MMSHVSQRHSRHNVTRVTTSHVSRCHEVTGTMTQKVAASVTCDIVTV